MKRLFKRYQRVIRFTKRLLRSWNARKVRAHVGRVNVGCVHLLALLDGPAGLCHIVLYLLPADNAYIVSTYQGLCCGEGNGKVGIGVEVDRGLMVAHRNHDLVIIPLTTPRCVGYRLLPSRLGKAQASLALRSLLRQFIALGVPSAL